MPPCMQFWCLYLVKCSCQCQNSYFYALLAWLPCKSNTQFFWTCSNKFNCLHAKCNSFLLTGGIFGNHSSGSKIYLPFKSHFLQPGGNKQLVRNVLMHTLQEDHLSLRVIWNAKYMSKHSQQKRIHLFTDKVSYNSTPSQQTILFFHIILLDLKRDFLDTLLEHHCYKNKMLRNIEKCPTLLSG